MMPGTEPAARLLRSLLDDAPLEPDTVDWAAVWRLVERNHMELRVAAHLERHGAQIPVQLAEAATRAGIRSARALELVARIGANCERHGIAHVFLKTAQHHPDTGRDIDLLVPASTRTAGELCLRGALDAVRGRPARSRLAGTSTFTLRDSGMILDVHHGRLGRLGEHARYADQLLRRRRRVRIGSMNCFAPTPEDQLLLLAIQRLHGRPALRVADVYWTLATVRAGGVNPDRLVTHARDAGLLPALSCLLDCMEQIHRGLVGRPLLDAALRNELVDSGRPRVWFRNGSYRVAALRVTGQHWLERLRTDLRARDWAAAGRVCLLPLIAAAAGLRRQA